MSEKIPLEGPGDRWFSGLKSAATIFETNDGEIVCLPEFSGRHQF